MRKIVKISAAIILAIGVVFASALYYGRKSAMSALHIQHPEIALGPLPLSMTQIGEIAPGLNFRIDTGSSANTISQEYLQKLKAKGFDVDSSFVLTYVKTAIGGRRITTKRYRVSLPVYAYDIEIDGGKVVSRIDTTNLINRLENVDFVPTSSATEIPRLGRPFLRRFFMEYDHDIRAVRFHTSMPEDYEEMQGMSTEFTIFSEPAYFLTLKVDGSEHDYFLNSSMPRAGILKPMAHAPEPDGKNVYKDFIPSIFGRISAIIDYGAWVEWNDRGGNNVCYYSDYGARPYALNPFNFLTQDAVFDFADSRCYLRQYSEPYRRLRSNDAFARAGEE